MTDTPTIHPTKPESTASTQPTPLFGSEADSFVQQLRLIFLGARLWREPG